MAIIGFLFLIAVGIFFLVQGVRAVSALHVVMMFSDKLAWPIVAFIIIAFVVAAGAFIAAWHWAPFHVSLTVE